MQLEAPSNIVPFSALQRLFASQAWAEAELIACDYDGVVADTEKFQMSAFMRIAMERGTSTEPLKEKTFEEFVKRHIGRPEEAILTDIKHERDVTDPIDTLLKDRAHMYLDVARDNLAPNPDTIEIMKAARKEGKRFMILSNGRSNVLGDLNNHWGLWQYIDEFQTVDIRKIGAKDEYLLHRAKKRDLKASQIMLLEDGKKTIVSAESKTGACGTKINCVYFAHSLNDPTFVPATTGLVMNCINPLVSENVEAPNGANARKSILTANKTEYAHRPNVGG